MSTPGGYTDVPEDYDHLLKQVEIIKDREKVEMFYDQGYWPILAILREGRLSVREITVKSNQLIEKKELPKLKEKLENWEIPEDKEKLEKILNKISNWETLQIKDKDKEYTRVLTEDKISSLIKKEKLSKEESKLIRDVLLLYKIDNHKKSDKTIYRYINELTQAGLLIKAGQRVITGKTATETLYARNAKIYLLRQQAHDTWKCDECKATLEKVGALIGLSQKIDQPSVDSLAKLMAKIDMFHEDEQIRLFEQNEKKVLEIIKDCTFKETSHILETFKIIYLMMNSQEFKEELEDCC
ncbi:MAG: hypothetical protein H7644_05535 [Candidatus Heimdallarchaeota archaeon]|nr:hypothetical protein [Candidatus Heimdallarchaeota archaeon]MCK5143208.1 hypothetical protein [Candidatus Heimdallarchaeota archaeon]